MNRYSARAYKEYGQWLVVVEGVGVTDPTSTASRARRLAHRLVVERMGVDTMTVQVDIEFVQGAKK